MATPAQKRKPPTPQEIIADQKRRAAADHRKAAPLPVKLAATGSTAVATPDTRTDVQRYVDEIAPSSIAGRLIKFSKEGKFVGQQCPSLPHPFSQPRKVPKILREP